jgi:hypothetical protein
VPRTGTSLRRSLSHLASTTVTATSNLVLRPTFSSMKKVRDTGAGSASPVVSTRMAPNLPFFRISPAPGCDNSGTSSSSLTGLD